MSPGEFDELLIACRPDEVDDFIDQYILGGIPAVFENDQAKYDRFRKRVAVKFGVRPEDIVIVGSARLGFSYRKQTVFSLESDVDVAIVSEELFDEYSRIICRYNHDVIRYVVALSGVEWSRYLAFLKYFAAGWLRPDKGATIMRQHPRASDWWRYFKSISHGKSEVGDHKVNAGIYKSTYYLKEYVKIGLEDHKNSIMKTRSIEHERLQ